MPRYTDGIEEGILEYLNEKKSPVTFIDLYAALGKFSEQGIRNAVYGMIEKDMIKRVKPEPSPTNIKRRIKASFELKK